MVEWTRGKDSAGKTKRAKVDSDSLLFNEMLSFELRLYREKDAADSHFEAKHLSFSLKEKVEVRPPIPLSLMSSSSASRSRRKAKNRRASARR